MMGATEIISRDDYMSEPIKPLDKALYSAALDTVGGDILAKIISMVSNHGVVSSCGNVGGATFSSSVFPFILRGIQLSGIDSAESSSGLPDLKSQCLCHNRQTPGFPPSPWPKEDHYPPPGHGCH